MSQQKLGAFLAEVSNWSWEDFAKAEKDKQYTTNQSIIFALIRSCSMQKIDAIRMSLNRLDGKLKTPIKIEYPKVFYLFPHAQLRGDVRNEHTPVGPSGFARITSNPETTNEVEVVSGEVLAPPDIAPPPEKDLPSMSLRETLAEMSEYSRGLPEAITDLALQTEQWLRNQAPKPDEIPKVKSVVAAHLLLMAQKRNIDALTEVFDQIDGKLVETLHIVGEDIYITNYSDILPEGAELNDDGVYQIEATKTQDLWAQKLKDLR